MPDVNDDGFFTVLSLATLEIEIIRGWQDEAQPTLSGHPETLDGLIDLAIDGAAHSGNWQGLVRLRECLLKCAADAEATLVHIAKEGASRYAHPKPQAADC